MMVEGEFNMFFSMFGDFLCRGVPRLTASVLVATLKKSRKIWLKAHGLLLPRTTIKQPLQNHKYTHSQPTLLDILCTLLYESVRLSSFPTHPHANHLLGAASSTDLALHPTSRLPSPITANACDPLSQPQSWLTKVSRTSQRVSRTPVDDSCSVLPLLLGAHGCPAVQSQPLR
jgi:hypothetical protein